MNHLRHKLSRLSAIIISSFLLSTSAGTYAGIDDFIVTDNHQVSNHPELSLPTEFWRSEFLNNIESPERQDPAAAAGDQHPVLPGATMQDSAPGFLVASLEEELFRKHTATDSETAAGAPDFDVSNPHATPSEWEKAACFAVGPQGDRTTHNGPSVITAIVGVVGIVVVFGAYFSSARSA